MNKIKSFIFTALLLFCLNNVYSAAIDGTIVNANGFVQGGSNAVFTWSVPIADKQKVWIQIPNNSTASNALYRVFPKGNAANNSICDSNDKSYPCFEIAVNQLANKNKWVQLTQNNNVKTAWVFNKNGFISIDANNISSAEFLSVSAVSFEVVLPPIPLVIGQPYQGGFIFYLDKTGNHGLIASPDNIPNPDGYYDAFWLPQYTKVTNTGAIATAVGTGKANTAKIVKAQGAGVYAAKLCDDLVLNGYSDWYLPSKDELSLLINAKFDGNYNHYGWSPLNWGSYWSSSGYDLLPYNHVVTGWAYRSDISSWVNYGGGATAFVRAIRTF